MIASINAFSFQTKLLLSRGKAFEFLQSLHQKKLFAGMLLWLRFEGLQLRDVFHDTWVDSRTWNHLIIHYHVQETKPQKFVAFSMFYASEKWKYHLMAIKKIVYVMNHAIVCSTTWKPKILKILGEFAIKLIIVWWLNNFDHCSAREMMNLKFHPSEFNLLFKDRHFFPIYHKAQFNMVDVIALVGGFFGLFLGFSILSFVEIIYYFMMRPIINKKGSKKRTAFAEESKHKAFKNFTIELLNESSIHGFNYIGEKDARLAQRYWIISASTTLIV